MGFEPHDLRVMSPTSYRLLYPAILDCKYTDIFLIRKFYFTFLRERSLDKLGMTSEEARDDIKAEHGMTSGSAEKGYHSFNISLGEGLLLACCEVLQVYCSFCDFISSDDGQERNRLLVGVVELLLQLCLFRIYLA